MTFAELKQNQSQVCTRSVFWPEQINLWDEVTKAVVNWTQWANRQQEQDPCGNDG